MGHVEAREVRLECAPHGNGATVILRTADEDDAASLLELDRHVRRTSTFKVREEDELEQDPAAYAKFIRQHREDDARLYLVASPPGASSLPGGIAGRLTFHPGQHRRTRHHGEFGIAVHAEWRGRGVGRALITTLLRWAAAHPVLERVCLGVFADNERAIGLYRSMGFREEGRAPRHFRIPAEGGRPERHVDDIRMSIFVKAGLAPAGFNTWMSGECVGAVADRLSEVRR